MNLHVLDYCILLTIVPGLVVIGLVCKKYNKSVADFLVANRCGGRYLLTMAEGAAGVGTISIVAFWEMGYYAGFPPIWWSLMLVPVTLFLSLFGWISYRFRETRALTMAQFMELRYSRKFRIFTGIIAWLSGILNYAIFPSITARCFIYFFGIPVYTTHAGPIEVNLTLGVIMFIMLAYAVTLTILGGQITIMITDFFQGQLSNIVFVLIGIVLLFQIGWPQIVETLKSAPPGKSMLNPFDQGQLPDFNFVYFMIQFVLIVYGYRMWHGTQACNSSAKSAHEAKMAVIISRWRGYFSTLMFSLAPVVIFVIMNNSNFADIASVVRTNLADVPNEHLRQQMTVPLALSRVLPTGVIGLLASVLICASVSVDDSYIHSWGSILIQDIVMPLRGKPFSPKAHMRLLKCSMIGVAAFVWLFSMVFTLREHILMYMDITAAIYMGGIGAVIVGGLYWRRGTTAGAWAGMITGSSLAIFAIMLRNVLWPFIAYFAVSHPEAGWLTNLPEEFPLNGTQMYFVTAMTACLTYALVSLFTKPDPNFSMEKMLHRDVPNPRLMTEKLTQKFRWQSLLGITKEFTLFDKFISVATFGLTAATVLMFATGTIIYLVYPFSDDVWSEIWRYFIYYNIGAAVFTAVWFIWGGTKDIKELFFRLTTIRRNDADNGSVIGHRNAADTANNENKPAPEPE